MKTSFVTVAIMSLQGVMAASLLPRGQIASSIGSLGNGIYESFQDGGVEKFKFSPLPQPDNSTSPPQRAARDTATSLVPRGPDPQVVCGAHGGNVFLNYQDFWTARNNLAFTLGVSGTTITGAKVSVRVDKQIKTCEANGC
jgi:hypothetical protein